VIEGAPNFWDAIYVYAWFTGFGIAFGVYYAMSKAMRPNLSAPSS
jgi:cytosine/uracil/thiamine/allantoin permease